MMAEEWLFFFVLQTEILTVLVHARIVFWAAHTIHAPLQVPKPWYDKYAHINDDERRRKYLAMVNWLDDAVGNVTALLKSKDMYDTTLIVFSSECVSFFLFIWPS